MKFFLGLLIILPLSLRADNSAVTIHQSGNVDAFYRTSFQLLVGNKALDTSSYAFEIRLRGEPNVPCDTDRVIPDASLLLDNRGESIFLIQMRLIRGASTPGCVNSKKMAFVAPWLEVHASSSRVTFFTPENVKLDLQKARITD